MTNKYFNWQSSLRRFVRFDAARSEDVNDALDDISVAMDGVDADTRRSIKLPASASDQLLDLTPEQRANLVLGFDPAGLLAGVPGGGRFAGDWAAGVGYLVSETFRDPETKNIYSTAVAHTSTAIADDLASGKIRLAINVIDVEVAKDAAAASASTAAEQATSAAGSAGTAAEQADLTLSYSNTAGTHAATATDKAALATAASEAAALSQAAAQGSAAAAAIDAQRAEDAAASIADGPVTSVGGATGVVNVKTVNGQPIVGTGNIQIEGFTLAQAQAVALSF